MWPCIFLNHGGGPMPLFANNSDPVRKHLMRVGSHIEKDNMKPKAILVISAHYESDPSVLVTSAAKPDMYFDYYGFPAEAYKIKYPAPGDPELANRIKCLLGEKGIPCELDKKRGFDHGVFVPLMVAYPKADIPVVTLSLHSSFDPKLHIEMGEALQPLREEGVLIIGSGMSFHNMRARGPKGKPRGLDFDGALRQVITEMEPEKRNEILAKWDTLPGARNAHAREEHLLPLLVVAGAAGSQKGHADSAEIMNAAISGFTFM